MAEKSDHTEKKSRRKWPWIVLLSLVCLIGLVRLSLMSGPVHHWVKNMIVNAAGKQLKPRLFIGNLSGDLWNSATLTNVKLTKNDSTVASIDTVHVEYDALSYFSDAFQIRRLRIVRPFLRLVQQRDTTWNVQHWLTTTDTAATDTSGGFAFSLSDLKIRQGRVDVATIQIPKDSSFVVDEMNLAGSLGYFGDSYTVGVDDFNFKIKETRLDAPISFSASADASPPKISLQKLALATGNSLLHASGRANLADSTANFQASANPLGWKDLSAYTDSLPVQKDVNMSLKLSGNLQQFEVGLNANAEGIDQLSLHGTFQHDSEFVLTDFSASANQLNLAAFLGDTSMPQLQNLDFQASGRVPFDDYERAKMKGTLSISDIHQNSYKVDRLRGNFSVENQQAKIRLGPVNDGEKLIAKANISHVFGDQPGIDVSVSGSDISPASWTQDTDLAGALTFNGHISGTGWVPEQQAWNYQLNVNKSRLMDQPIDSASFSGRFSLQSFTNESSVSIGQSEIHLQAQAGQLQARPTFNYELTFKKVNLADLKNLEKYPSSITGKIRGNGQGNALENLKMQMQADVDSSTFKGEKIHQFTMDASLARSMLAIKQAQLKSTIADAVVNGKLNLQNFYDFQNNLNLDIEIKDVATFASVADVDVLQAKGSLEGKLEPAGKDSLVFDGRVNLSDIIYGDQFTAKRINGGVRVDINHQPKYLVDIKVDQPAVASLDLQNMDIKTEGQLKETTTSGSFSLDLANAREGRIVQKGTYRVSDDSVAVKLTTLDLTSSQRTLSLQKPFRATFANQTLKTDTLHVSSEDSAAYLELAVPFADSLHQKAYVKAKRLNLEAIQNAIFDKPFFSGILNALVQVDRTDTSMTAVGNVSMINLEYQEANLDTLRLQADIENERLRGMLEVYQDSELIAEGRTDIPFKAKKPSDLQNGFFEKPVSGHLTLHALSLDRFSKLLAQAGYKDTKGTVQFDGSLEGQAGEPRFSAKLSLKDAQLSGVPIDSLIASAHYRHSDSELDLNATLSSLKQKALDMNAKVPLKVDLHNLEVGLPGPQDSISVDVKTHDFNLKALNDFVGRSTARNIRGLINGDVQINGLRSNLQANGELTLKKGAVRAVPAGIRLDHISSTVQIKPDQIVLENFHTESGKGDLDAQGKLGLKKLVPGNINVKVKARNFKAANTDHYNALVNLDMNVGGSVTEPKVTGKLEMINGFVELDNFGEKSVEEVNLDTTVSTEPNISLYDSLSLNLNISFNRRFYVRNQRYLKMEIELDGQLDVLKDPGQDLQLFGTLDTDNGYAEPLGKRFELQEGSLAFSGPPDNPQINIRTLYEPPQSDQDIKIWYVIEGTVEDPQFKYESEPPMDLAGIISYTLFGQPFYKLNPTEQTVASSTGNSTVADLAMDVLMDRVESLATKELGIDVVRIENTRVGGESGTSVTTGWYINPKVFFAIQNVITGSTPTTGFYLEYYLKESLKLILSQGNNNRQGIDIQWEHDY